MKCFRFRRIQIRLLQSKDVLPVYYPEDAEIFLHTGTLPDGSLVCVLFNLGYDPLSFIPFKTTFGIKRVRALKRNGGYFDCKFTYKNNLLTVQASCSIFDPVVLILSRN